MLHALCKYLLLLILIQSVSFAYPIRLDFAVEYVFAPLPIHGVSIDDGSADSLKILRAFLGLNPTLCC